MISYVATIMLLKFIGKCFSDFNRLMNCVLSGDLVDRKILIQ